MCVDFTDSNVACPKDPYPLPNIDRLIDGPPYSCMLNFMDAYSGYNQIWRDPLDASKIVLMLNHGNYYYHAIPSSLKNVGATYQRLIGFIFSHHIWRNLEVYVVDMIVKIVEGCSHAENLEDSLHLLLVKKYDIRLKSTKCSFEVQDGKFLGFVLTNRCIEANR